VTERRRDLAARWEQRVMRAAHPVAYPALGLLRAPARRVPGLGVLVRDAALLKQAFHVATTYMPSPGLDRDPFVTSLLWSRRFMGLRLFLNLAAAGWAGYARHVERAVHLSRLIADGVAARGWSVANDSPCGVVCMVPPEGRIPPATIVRHMLARGDAWVSLARYEGREVVRACVTHGRTDAGDVDRLVACLESASEVGSAEEKC